MHRKPVCKRKIAILHSLVNHFDELALMSRIKSARACLAAGREDMNMVFDSADFQKLAVFIVIIPAMYLYRLLFFLPRSTCGDIWWRHDVVGKAGIDIVLVLVSPPSRLRWSCAAFLGLPPRLLHVAPSGNA